MRESLTKLTRNPLFPRDSARDVAPFGGLLLIAVTVGTLLRFYGLNEPQLWLDELIQISRSTQPSLQAILSDVRSETAAVPLDYLVQGFFVRLLGASAWAARLHAALFGCLSLLVMLWLGSRLFGLLDGLTPRWGGLLSTFLLAFYPLHIFYSQEGRNYSLFFFCTLLSFALLVEALQRRSPWWWALHSVAVLGMLYSNYLGVLALAAQGAFMLLYPWASRSGFRSGVRKPLRRVWAGFAFSALTAFLLFLPWLLQTYSRAQGAFEEDFWSLRFAGRFIQESSGGSWPLSLLLLALAAAGFRNLRQRRSQEAAALLLCWLCIPVAAVLFLDWYRGYFFAARQILFASPALLLAAASGLGGLMHWQQSRARYPAAAATLVLTAGLGAGTVLISNDKQPADWQALDHYLRSHLAEGDRIAAPHIERPVAWRYPELNRRLIAMNDLLPGGRWPQGAPRLQLIESRYATAQQRQAMAEALAATSSSETVEIDGFRVHVIWAEPR